MLVLSRRKGERIVIGETVILTVIEVRGNRTRLGIEAPRNVGVYRQEVVEASNSLDTQPLKERELPKPR